MEKYLKGNFFKMFLAFAFLNDFGMFYSLYNYIFSQSGMSVFQVSTILSCGQIGKIIFDIPGGILNDKYNKKFAFYIGIFAKILAMIIFINFKNYYTFIAAMFLVGISWSCTFGKLETFLYSQLEAKENFTKQIGIMYSLVNLSIAIASYITSKIYSTEAILYMQIGVYLAALLVLFFTQTHHHQRPQNQKINITKAKASLAARVQSYLQRIRRSTFDNKKLTSFIFLAIAFESLFIIMIDLNTNLMIKFNFQRETISKVVSLVAFIRIFTNLISGYLIRFIKFKIFTIYFFSIFLQILLLTIFAPQISFIAISGYLCLYTPLSLFVLKNIQDMIDDENRNLILSAISMATSICAMIIDLSFSFLGWISGVQVISIVLILFFSLRIKYFIKISSNTCAE